MAMVLWDEDFNRRRISEESRRARIFDAKQRQIGLDIETLNRQVHENRLARDKQMEKEKLFVETARRNDKLALHTQFQEKKIMQEEHKKMDEFRMTSQRPEHGRDFDLYDPDGKKKEFPLRTRARDECPVSGIQKMDGEDLNFEDRQRRQKNQYQDLLLQQIEERRMQSGRQRAMENDWENRLMRQDNYGLKLSCAELGNRKDASLTLHDLNRNLAFQQRERFIQQKASEEAENLKEIEFNVFGDLLTENPTAARTPMGRVLVDRWKGMEKAQLQEFYEGQRRQIDEKQKKLERELFEKEEWNKYILGQQNDSRYLDERARQLRLQFSKSLQMENQQLAREQRQKNDYMNKVVYSNVPSKEFFDQFNTSSR
ncbi:hypothetical protein JTE90_002424 [Oedothorax gibbosus]|uniref:RIB43A-like with coiled-coils protein 2 n=1 Tax=Oedothorax gibbosus TaxID=931172 RepID=A0AAV6UUS6_9ARAC|nr:hypothetical protein JTE90_002424 [Oedothorax gibbosus]